MKEYDVILFDQDGTIADSGRGIINSVKYSLKKYGINETDDQKLRYFVGPPLYESYEKLYGFSHEKAVEAVAFYREYYNAGGIFELSLYDGIIDLLKSLKNAGKTVIVATSKPEIYAERIAEKFDYKKYFDSISGALLDGSRITKPDIIRYALDRNGITDMSRVLMVGDRCFDIEGAKQFSIDSVGVTWGYGTREELEKAGATYIVDSPEEIKEILKVKSLD